MATVTDPVCNMQIDSSQAAAQAVHDGKAYFFCSDECRKLFLKNPEMYLNARNEPQSEPIPLP